MILLWLIDIYTMVVIAAAVLSWFDPGSRNPLARFLNKLTDPLLNPLRKVLPRIGIFDLSPVVLILLLQLFRYLLINYLGG